MNESKFLTDSRNLNIAIILLFILYIIWFIGGLLYASLGTFMPYHNEFTGLSESKVRNYNSELMILIGVFIRLIGFLYLNYAISNLYILFIGFRKKEKWAWIITLISGVVFFIPHLLITYVVLGLNINYIGFIICTIAWIFSLGISYKEFFK